MFYESLFEFEETFVHFFYTFELKNFLHFLNRGVTAIDQFYFYRDMRTIQGTLESAVKYV